MLPKTGNNCLFFSHKFTKKFRKRLFSSVKKLTVFAEKQAFIIHLRP